MSQDGNPEDRLLKVVESVSSLIGPVAVLTSILYFFGWRRTVADFEYFGVDASILNFGPQDYIVRAVGPAFVPGVVALLIAIALYVIDQSGVRLELLCILNPVRIGRFTLVARIPSLLLTYLGLVTFWCGIRVALSLPDYFGVGAAYGLVDPIPGAVALGVGPIVLALGLRLLMVRPSSERPFWPPRIPAVPKALLIVAVLIGAFWATSIYSENAGDALASEENERPQIQAEVTVYSQDSLDMWSDQMVRPAPAAEHFRYVYTGLRLLIYANSRWLLLTGERAADGRHKVVILNDNDRIRVEISA